MGLGELHGGAGRVVGPGRVWKLCAPFPMLCPTHLSTWVSICTLYHTYPFIINWQIIRKFPVSCSNTLIESEEWVVGTSDL